MEKEKMMAPDDALKVSKSSDGTLSIATVTSINIDDNVFRPVWETEGLKIPSVTTINGRPNLYYMRIPREEVAKMVKDIMEELSHT